MSIRFKLLLLCLTTLVLPWAGCQYAGELEIVLRAAQEQTLLASAGTISNALAAQPQRLFRSKAAVSEFAPAKGDLYAFPLRAQPALDGYYRDDWDTGQQAKTLPSRDKLVARLQAGVTDRYLFLYIEVEDSIFDAEPPDPFPRSNRFDRVDFLLEQPDGGRQSFFFATNAPGLIAAQAIERNLLGEEIVIAEPRIQAYWLQSGRGYHVEARVPLSVVGERLWIQVVDGRKSGTRTAGTMDLARHGSGGRLVFASPGINDMLATFVRDGTRATVIDRNELKLGVSGDWHTREARAQNEPGQSLYRSLVGADAARYPPLTEFPDRVEGQYVDSALAGKPMAQWFRRGRGDEVLLSAAAPIVIEGDPVGAVILEQAGEQLVGIRDRALARLFNLTLLATAIAVAFVSAFATWLSLRIGKLARAADSAALAGGHIKAELPESASHDELGDLSRSFSRLLRRLDEYTQYLRGLGGKLSHELRTPLTIVRSSLDNLESEGIRTDQRVYLERAREGAERLGSILSAIGAASRVEQSIQHTDRVPFDLGDLLKSVVAAYRDSFKPCCFELLVPPEACALRGAPDLILQMLDKLIENAVDFCRPDGSIRVSLLRETANYQLSVENDGPPIPADVLGRLFESLFEFREDHDDKPHFGLGLYIVRLIAEFHGGSARAENRASPPGVVFTVSLPYL